MATTLYGTFTDIELAERAVGAMIDYGVRPDDISLVRNHRDEAEATKPAEPVGISNTEHGANASGIIDGVGGYKLDSNGLAAETEVQRAAGADPNYQPGSSRVSDTDYDTLNSKYDTVDHYDPEQGAKHGLTATTKEDAGAGAIKGASVGLGLGAIAVIASIFVPGFGFFAGGGALATALAGLAGTTGAGAIAGAVTGYLKDQGMDSHLAEHYGEQVGQGGALVSVTVPSDHVDESTVRSIFDKYGATHITNFAGTGSGGYVA
jgi:hypothetical protein